MVALVALFAALLLGACGGSAPESPGGAQGQGAPAAATKSAPASPAAASGTKSGATPAAGAAVKLEACKLVTKDEVVAVTGPVGAPKEEPPLVDMMASCRFPNAESPVAAEVMVSIVAYADAATAASEMKNTIQRNKYEEVAGLGEQAYTTWPLPGVTVRKGRYELSIDVLPAADGETKAQNIARTRTLLEKALPRVP